LLVPGLDVFGDLLELLELEVGVGIAELGVCDGVESGLEESGERVVVGRHDCLSEVK